MKVIFLDIDGVMISSRCLKEQKQEELNFDLETLLEKLERNESIISEKRFDSKCVEYLKMVIEATDAKIVISSSWRIDRSLERLQEIFGMYGLSEYIVNKTPFFNDFTKIRGDEIKAYIESVKGTELEVEKFVIFDDEEKMGELTPFYVQTNPTYGLWKKDVKKAIELLNQL